MIPVFLVSSIYHWSFAQCISFGVYYLADGFLNTGVTIQHSCAGLFFCRHQLYRKREKAYCIFRRCPLHFIRGNTIQLSNLFDDCRGNQRGIPDTAEEFGLDHIFEVEQYERGIGLYQNTFQWDLRNRFPQILRPFFHLKNGATNADMVTQFQILLRNFLGAIEAVDHTNQLPSRGPFEYPERILMGVPNMEHHRQFHLPCQIQLVYAPDVLLRSVLFLTRIVIVQTDFSDSNHTWHILICSDFCRSDHFSKMDLVGWMPVAGNIRSGYCAASSSTS